MDGALAESGPPSGVSVADLIAFGTCVYGDVYLHRHDGSVHIWSRLDGPTRQVLVPLSPDLDVFTRILEAINRYSNACWHPHPVEEDQEAVAQVFLDEMEELAPGLLDPKTPSGTVWSWLYAGITELGGMASSACRSPRQPPSGSDSGTPVSEWRARTRVRARPREAGDECHPVRPGHVPSVVGGTLRRCCPT